MFVEPQWSRTADGLMQLLKSLQRHACHPSPADGDVHRGRQARQPAHLGAGREGHGCGPGHSASRAAQEHCVSSWLCFDWVHRLACASSLATGVPLAGAAACSQRQPSFRHFQAPAILTLRMSPHLAACNLTCCHCFLLPASFPTPSPTASLPHSLQHDLLLRRRAEGGLLPLRGAGGGLACCESLTF